MQTQVINGRYRVESQLGRGSQGEVLLALDQKLGRHVALKMLRVNQDFASQAGQSLRREAMIMARFHNPHVVSVYDYDTSSADGSPFLVMEYLQGETLDKLSSPLTNDELRTLVSQVGNALQNAHEIGLVHRDLKPANLMLIEREKVTRRFMVLDLGIAKLTDVANPSMQSFAGITFSGAGTPFYMAPEQAKAAHVDHRADIYAMGSIIYEFMSGEPVFSGSADSMLTLLNAIISTEPVPISQVSSRACSPALNDLIMQCLEKSPDLRPSSMNEVVIRFLDHFASNMAADTQPAPNVATPSIEASLTNTFTGQTVQAKHSDTAKQGAKTEPPPVPVEVTRSEASGTSRRASDDTQKPEATQGYNTIDSASVFPRTWIAALVVLGILAVSIPTAVILLNGEPSPAEAGGNGPDNPTTQTTVEVDLGQIEVREGESWTYAFDTGSDDFESFVIEGQPPLGMELDNATGALSWQPNEDQGSGNFQIKVTAKRADESAVLSTLRLRVTETNVAPEIEPLPSIESDELKEVQFTAKAADADRPSTSLTYRLGPNAPTTARIDAKTGRFQWTPSESDGPGQFQFSVEVSDGVATSSTPVSIDVREINVPPSFKPIAPIEEDEAELIAFTLEASDEDLPPNKIEYSMKSAPDGASFDPETGKFTWTPSEEQGPGEFDVEFQVNDGSMVSPLTVEIAVNEVSRAPIVSEIPSQTAELGKGFGYRIEAMDPDLPTMPLRYSLVNEPEGMTIDEQTGLIFWIPDVAYAGKEITIDVEVAKSERLLTSEEFRLMVGPGALTTNSIGMELRLIPSGSFMMGSPDGETQRGEDESLHAVEHTVPILMGAHEVTQQQYEQVMGLTPSHFQANGEGADDVGDLDTDSFPVESVSYDDAIAFCQKLTELEEEFGRRYRLPTEAEWEYACRAGSATPFSFAEVANGTLANLNGQSPYGVAVKGPYLGRTAATGSYAPNSFGLYDMHGNVAEWCQDHHSESYYLESPETDPVGPESGSYRVQRGGSWRNPAHRCRAASRNFGSPSDRTFFVGFRVVCESN